MLFKLEEICKVTSGGVTVKLFRGKDVIATVITRPSSVEDMQLNVINEKEIVENKEMFTSLQASIEEFIREKVEDIVPSIEFDIISKYIIK